MCAVRDRCVQVRALLGWGYQNRVRSRLDGIRIRNGRDLPGMQYFDKSRYYSQRKNVRRKFFEYIDRHSTEYAKAQTSPGFNAMHTLPQLGGLLIPVRPILVPPFPQAPGEIGFGAIF